MTTRSNEHSMTISDDVERFHVKFGLKYEGLPRFLTGEMAEFRRRFLEEELDEYKKAMYQGIYWIAQDPDSPRVVECLAEALDALVDLVYVARGTAYLMGLDFDEAWRRVQDANMRKIRAERASDSKRDTKFDVVKPPGWSPPDHTDLVVNHAHRTDVKKAKFHSSPVPKNSYGRIVED